MREQNKAKAMGHSENILIVKKAFIIAFPLNKKQVHPINTNPEPMNQYDRIENGFHL